MSSWFNVLIYALLNQGKYPGYNLYEEVVTLIRYSVDYAQMFHQDLYIMTKMWPSLSIAAILRDQENNPIFYTALRPDVPHSHHPLYAWINRPAVTEAFVHMSLELSGLGKIFGHPVIDMNASVRSWSRKGSVMKLDKETMGRDCSEMFKLTLCRWYYEERNRWPPLELSGEEAEHVRYNYHRGTWNETPGRKWQSSDFKGVRFQQTFEFDMYVDPSDLLSDKSIIPTEQHWPYEFDEQAHRSI